MKKNVLTWIVALAAVIICFAVLPTKAQAASASDLTFKLNSDGKSYTVSRCSSSASGELVIPATYDGKPVTSISATAFIQCTRLTKITIPDSVTSIGNSAFFYCSGLTSITIPDSVTSLGADVFDYCNNLAYTEYDNALYLGNSNNPYAALAKLKSKNITQCNIHSKTKCIANDAFKSCKELTSITIPDSVTAIGNEAFRACTSLTSVTIGNGVTSIGELAFYYCENLTSVTIGTGVTSIGYQAFSMVDKLWHVLYKGTKDQWKEISLDSYAFLAWTSTPTHYECTGNEITDPVKKVCTICSAASCNHTWNAGTVTKTATCKEAGIKTFTCATCGRTKTESIDKLPHTYGNWASVNETSHKRTCSACQSEETNAHQWNTGVVTKKATCKETGIKTYTCTTCGSTKTETIPKLTTHTYDNACDATCNVCGNTRTVSHQYSSAWNTSKTEHWHECSICGNKKDLAAHTPGAAATETTAQTCTTCGYIIAPALNHTHDYANELTNDREGHWYACSGCSEQKDYAAHVYTNACDTDCSDCGYVRTTTHNYSQNWTSDSAKHWHACSVCGEKTDEDAHVPGMQATETTAQTCTVCGYEIAPALGATENKPSNTPDDSTAANTPTDSTGNEKGENNTILILVLGIAIGGGIAIVTVLVTKKKDANS